MNNVDNHNITDHENAITPRQLKSEAMNGRFYSYEEHKWQSMRWVEWLIRTIFVCFIDSAQTTCLRRSWKAIEKMPNTPPDIKENIKDLFLHSFRPTNLDFYSLSDIIGLIFCKVLHENARKNGSTVNEIDIQQLSKGRSFNIFFNEELRYLATNSAYGRIDFYNSARIKVAINDYDSLWSPENKRIGAIRLPVDYSRLDYLELCSGDDCPLVKIEENKEKVTLVFRDTITNQLLAVGNLSKLGRLINWKVTLIDQDTLNQRQITPILVAWAILKYSQHHHFLDPVKYVENPPQSYDRQIAAL